MEPGGAGQNPALPNILVRSCPTLNQDAIVRTCPLVDRVSPAEGTLWTVPWGFGTAQYVQVRLLEFSTPSVLS